eukprot:g33273.t1
MLKKAERALQAFAPKEDLVLNTMSKLALEPWATRAKIRVSTATEIVVQRTNGPVHKRWNKQRVPTANGEFLRNWPRSLGRKGAAAQAAARAAAVVAKASIARGGDANRSDCLIEVADVEQVLPGSDEAWAAKVKVMLQQVFRRYGPVLDVRVPTGEANPIVGIRFANAKAAEAAMVAASQGFLAIHDAEVRLCQPLSREVIWRTFPSARRRRGEPPTEPKKKKLRPNERFAARRAQKRRLFRPS